LAVRRLVIGYRVQGPGRRVQRIRGREPGESQAGVSLAIMVEAQRTDSA
jgi:hypothetical protein